MKNRFGGFRTRQLFSVWDKRVSPSASSTPVPETIQDFDYTTAQGIWNLNSTTQFSKKTAAALYDFTAFTFTNGTQTGRFGPSLANLLAAYNTTLNPWLNDTEFFTSSDGYQLWTVPSSGSYRIQVAGARGGNTIGSSGHLGGLGATIEGDFSLESGQKLLILVGQTGVDRSTTCGGGYGGGGSFVTLGTSFSTSEIMIAAGGGGGAGYGTGGNGNPGLNSETGGVSSQSPSGAAGTNGNGGGIPTAGCASSEGSGGGGFIGNGSNGNGADSTSGGRSFRNGGAGGSAGGGFGVVVEVAVIIMAAVAVVDILEVVLVDWLEIVHAGQWETLAEEVHTTMASTK
jgi:hypothetical protein